MSHRIPGPQRAHHTKSSDEAAIDKLIPSTRRSHCYRENSKGSWLESAFGDGMRRQLSSYLGIPDIDKFFALASKASSGSSPGLLFSTGKWKNKPCVWEFDVKSKGGKNVLSGIKFPPTFRHKDSKVCYQVGDLIFPMELTWDQIKIQKGVDKVNPAPRNGYLMLLYLLLNDGQTPKVKFANQIVSITPDGGGGGSVWLIPVAISGGIPIFLGPGDSYAIHDSDTSGQAMIGHRGFEYSLNYSMRRWEFADDLASLASFLEWYIVIVASFVSAAFTGGAGIIGAALTAVGRKAVLKTAAKQYGRWLTKKLKTKFVKAVAKALPKMTLAFAKAFTKTYIEHYEIANTVSFYASGKEALSPQNQKNS